MHAQPAQVRARREGTIGVIELHNPPDQFMTAAMVGELDDLTSRWEHDDDVRAIVITGTKPGTFITHFSVEELRNSSPGFPRALPRAVLSGVEAAVGGFDRAQRILGAFPELRRRLERSHALPPLRGALLLNQIHRVFSRIERMDKAVVAALNGSAMGGGCELALACDYRLMARGDFVIGLIEVLGGIIPGAGGTQRLAATVGRARATEMVLDGVLCSPEEAERIGLVTRVVDGDRLMDEAMGLARRLSTRPLAALGNAKRAIRVGSSLPIDDGLLFEKLAFVASGLHPDAVRLAREYIARFRGGVSARDIFTALREHGA